MPTAEFDLSPAQVTEFIQSLTHETRWRFLNEVNNHIEWDNFDNLDLETVDIEASEAGEKPGFKCPHCDEVFRADKLVSVDYARAERELVRVDHDRQIVFTYKEDDIDEVEFEHAVLLCPECREPVALPYRWGHEHE